MHNTKKAVTTTLVVTAFVFSLSRTIRFGFFHAFTALFAGFHEGLKDLLHVFVVVHLPCQGCLFVGTILFYFFSNLGASRTASARPQMPAVSFAAIMGTETSGAAAAR